MRLFLLSIVAFAVTLSSSSAALAVELDFTVINGTGVTVEQLYVSSSDTTDWEEDVLGEDTLPAGGQLNVNFPSKARGQFFDLLALNPEGGQMMFQQLDLRAISIVTLTIQNGQPVAVIQ